MANAPHEKEHAGSGLDQPKLNGIVENAKVKLSELKSKLQQDRSAAGEKKDADVADTSEPGIIPD